MAEVGCGMRVWVRVAWLAGVGRRLVENGFARAATTVTYGRKEGRYSISAPSRVAAMYAGKEPVSDRTERQRHDGDE
jgi:hypothetical protein